MSEVCRTMRKVQRMQLLRCECAVVIKHCTECMVFRFAVCQCTAGVQSAWCAVCSPIPQQLSPNLGCGEELLGLRVSFGVRVPELVQW